MKNLNELYKWYETLTKENLFQIDTFYAKDAFFKDPFNEVKALEEIKKIYQDMFLHLENPSFIFIDKIESAHQVFLTWDFNFSVKDKKYTIHGSSHLKLNSEGLITYHRDYWDVGEELLLKIPVIKYFYNKLRMKLASTKKR